MRPRHARQARLAEVGEEGQAKIAATTARVRGAGVAAQVEARYLAGAGVGRIDVEDPSVARSGSAIDAGVTFALRDIEAEPDGAPGATRSALLELPPAARDVALGARRAVRVLRRAILGGPR